MATDDPVNPEEINLYKGLDKLPAALWEDVAILDPRQVCLNAGVTHNSLNGYRIPFLGTDYLVHPQERTIILSSQSPVHPPGFQTGMVLINYLTHATEEGLAGKMVTARELNGGALFFQGPHALNVTPVEQVYARNGAGMVEKALQWGGIQSNTGDAGFKILALPKILVAYTLYERDDEFEANLVVTFDANTDKHLPLDCIWAMINIITHRLAPNPN